MTKTPQEIKSFQLDILRAWGIVFLISIHLHPPRIMWILFNFNAFLLVLVSGATFALIYGDSYIEHLPYLRKRCVALMFPLYIFLFIYFTSAFVSFHFLHIPPRPYNQSYIIKSLLCYRSSGILFSWILLIYMILAITAPFIMRLNNIVKRNMEYFFIIFLFFLVHLMLINLLRQEGWTQVSLSNNYLFFIIPYSCVFAIGVRLHKCSVRNTIWSALILFSLFGILAMKLAHTWGHFVLTQRYKHPLQLYYVLYSLPASLCLYRLSSYVTRCPVFVENVIVFISRGSLWVYLWHIAVLHLIQSPYTHLHFIKSSFVLSWMLVVLLAMAITFVQKEIVSSFVSSPNTGPKLKHYLKILFL